MMDQWNDLCQKICVDTDKRKKWWDIISQHYSEPWRHYHTLEHVQAMLRHMKDDEGVLENSMEVALAIYFHDIVYEPKSSHNEERSAELFSVFSDECLSGHSSINPSHITDMILSTRTHCTAAHTTESYGTEDVHYMLDYDMSVLGQHETTYLQYTDAIRKEYSHVPGLEYCDRRARVLESFLAVPKIFCTEKYHSKYEKIARENIVEEIASLKSRVCT